MKQEQWWRKGTVESLVSHSVALRALWHFRNVFTLSCVFVACAYEYDYYYYYYFAWSCATGEGISAMKTDPDKDIASWQAFNACMADIMKYVPAKKWKTTPLFLGATAGMRLLQ